MASPRKKNTKTISYIGYTTTKLSRKLTVHLSDSNNMCQYLKKPIFVNYTKILHTDNNMKELKILEALCIKFRQTTINKINFETNDNILRCLR